MSTSINNYFQITAKATNEIRKYFKIKVEITYEVVDFTNVNELFDYRTLYS